MLKSSATGKRFRGWILAMAVIGTGLSLLAGTVRDPWLWAYIAVFAIIGSYAICTLDDDLAQERFHPPSPGADATPLLWVRLAALAHLVVGAIDSGRLHLTPVAPQLRLVGLGGMLLSALIILQAMHTNHFFSAVVRIQDDRGHHVVDRGPYALIRHPGYAGMILLVPFSALALGSWAALGVALIYSAMVLRRVSFEDNFLKSHLDGYHDYTRRVPYRLVPHVW
jgi:protein-S-isoprenylcysteine O-methyltransferase Ste14